MHSSAFGTVPRIVFRRLSSAARFSRLNAVRKPSNVFAGSFGLERRLIPLFAQRERDKPRQGVVANSLDMFRQGAVGFIDWWVFSAHSDSHHAQTQCGRESSYIA